MNSQPDKDEAAGTMLKASLLFLKYEECERVKGQLSYIVQDMKEERQQNPSRGFHMYLQLAGLFFESLHVVSTT